MIHAVAVAAKKGQNQQHVPPVKVMARCVFSRASLSLNAPVRRAVVQAKLLPIHAVVVMDRAALNARRILTLKFQRVLMKAHAFASATKVKPAYAAVQPGIYMYLLASNHTVSLSGVEAISIAVYQFQ